MNILLQILWKPLKRELFIVWSVVSNIDVRTHRFFVFLMIYDLVWSSFETTSFINRIEIIGKHWISLIEIIIKLINKHFNCRMMEFDEII